MCATDAGLSLEYEASEAQRAIFRQAFDAAGSEAAEGWSSVMGCIYKPLDEYLPEGRILRMNKSSSTADDILAVPGP
jgi:hypothetical protein